MACLRRYEYSCGDLPAFISDRLSFIYSTCFVPRRGARVWPTVVPRSFM